MTEPRTPADKIPLQHIFPSQLVTRLARYHGCSWSEITVDPLLDMTEWDLRDVHGIGETYVKLIKDVLTPLGFALKPNPDTTQEVYLYDGERGRLHRFGQWMIDHPGVELDAALHEFLVLENQRGR